MRQKIKHKILVAGLGLVLALAMVLSACGKKADDSQSGTQSSSRSESSASSENPSGSQTQSDGGLLEKLKALDGVVDVSQVEISEENKDKTHFLATYVIEFIQPIDWDNPDLGTFTQRVMFGYLGMDNYMCYNTGGYVLSDIRKPGSLETAKGPDEIQGYYNCNYIDIEYRFFGKSVPDGFSLKSDKYWEYMTSENASKDFHHIITSMSELFKGSSFFTGASKGGYTTENMAYYFPDDIDCYVSRVAPLCDGTSDLRMLQNAYTAIGDVDPKYGPQKAAYYRNVLLEIQKLMLEDRYREVLEPLLMEQFDGKERTLSPLVTQSEAYEVSVAEMSISPWAGVQDFSEAEKIVQAPDSTEEEFSKKLEALKQYYLDDDPARNISYTTCTSPYYIQSYLEMGNYGMDFSYLRNAGAKITTPVENESDLYMRLWCPTIVGSDLQYSSEHREEIINFLNTTTKDIIKIYGLSDPWYSVHAPETSNPCVHVFTAQGGHSAGGKIQLDEAQLKEFHELVERLTGE